MRIKYPQPGDTRERKGFLWLPRYGNKLERWLEHAHWLEVWSFWGYGAGWIFVRWLDLEGGSE